MIESLPSVSLGSLGSPDSPDLSGTVIAGKYRVEHLLGQGGMGSVWAGRHVTLGQLVAIKFVHPKLAEIGRAHV